MEVSNARRLLQARLDLAELKMPNAPMRVLLVEDDDSIREVFKMMLEIEAPVPGLEVQTATDADEALFLARQSRFDVILLDLTLPKKNGFETFLDLRQLKNCESCQIIAVSAHNQQELIDRAINMGFAAYVTKPIDFENVLLPCCVKALANDIAPPKRPCLVFAHRSSA